MGRVREPACIDGCTEAFRELERGFEAREHAGFDSCAVLGIAAEQILGHPEPDPAEVV